jgi:hypothetical protein
MTYRERLTPWILVRFLPGMQRVIVGRFHKRTDAEGHLQFLQRQGGEFMIMFDLPAQHIQRAQSEIH